MGETFDNVCGHLTQRANDQIEYSYQVERKDYGSAKLMRSAANALNDALSAAQNRPQTNDTWSLGRLVFEIEESKSKYLEHWHDPYCNGAGLLTGAAGTAWAAYEKHGGTPWKFDRDNKKERATANPWVHKLMIWPKNRIGYTVLACIFLSLLLLMKT